MLFPQNFVHYNALKRLKRVLLGVLLLVCSVAAMMLKIIDKNVFKIVTISNNLVLICRF